MYYDHIAYGSMFGWFGMIIFWGALIWLIVYLVIRYKPNDPKTPLQIAKERYAKGELTKAQFHEMKKEL